MLAAKKCILSEVPISIYRLSFQYDRKTADMRQSQRLFGDLYQVTAGFWMEAEHRRRRRRGKKQKEEEGEYREKQGQEAQKELKVYFILLQIILEESVPKEKTIIKAQNIISY